EGTACTLIATGTGEDFGNFVDVAQTIREVFEAEGWTEDEAAIADGPTGTATSYFKDTTVAAVSVGWEPSDEVDCPADQPISACDIEPSQQNLTSSVELGEIALQKQTDLDVHPALKTQTGPPVHSPPNGSRLTQFSSPKPHMLALVR